MGRASALKLGMWIFLLSDAFSFSGLLISYGVLRAAALRWWPPGEPALGINFTAGLTFLLICSSVTMVIAVHAARHGKAGRTKAAAFLGLTILGGLLFLAGQYHEYFGIGSAGLLEQGLRLGHSQRATTFYVITSFHGAHVLTGVIILLVMLGRTLRADTPPGDAIESAGLFWHFVDLVWILVFTFVYLIPEAP
jgi:cytochrome c oxidase subunit 3